MLGDDKPAPQRFVNQSYRRDWPQAVIIQTQQPHGATVEVLAQGVDKPLQTHGIRQLDDQVSSQAFTRMG